MLTLHSFSEEQRLDRLTHILDTNLAENENDIGHPHNAYNLLKYWRDVVSIVEDKHSRGILGYDTEELGIVLPTHADVQGIWLFLAFGIWK